MIYDDETALKASWAFFGAPFVFPTHLMIALGVDANKRIILPYRFFASAAEARHACQFLIGKLGSVVKQLPSELQLEATDFDHRAASGPVTVERARSWDSEHWPIGSDQGDRYEWTVDLTGDSASFWFATKAALAVLAFMLWYCLPMWAAVAAWLIADYRFFGDWSFLGQRLGSAALVLGPAGLVVAVFTYAAVRAAIQIWRLRSQPMGIEMRSTGLHLSHATFDLWVAWTAVHGVVTSDDAAGWVIKESMEEVLYPQACFENRERFEHFTASLRRLGPADKETTTIVTGG